MDAATLARAMGCDRAVADRYVADFNAALVVAGCTTVPRVAMFCAQVGHESGGLRFMEELWGPTKAQRGYEGRRDLGNTVAGDGARFKGRGPIQLTGRAGYQAFGQWCAEQRLAAADLFVREPALVATSRWGFLAAAFYWRVRRPKLNDAADAGNLLLASQMVNGYVDRPNGLDDRQARWDRCRKMGDALLPGAAGAATLPPPATPATGPAGFRAAHGDVGAHVWRLASFLNSKFPLYSKIPLDRTPGAQRYGDTTQAVVAEYARRSSIGGADGGNVGPQIAAQLARDGFRG